MYPRSRKEIQLNVMVRFEFSLTSVLAIKLKNTKQVGKGWKLDVGNIPEEYKNEIEQKYNKHNKPARKKFRGNIESLEGHFQGGGRQNNPEERKEKQAQLDVPGHTEGRGEQAKNENGRKLGRSMKTKWRNTKKNRERQRKLSKEKNAGYWKSTMKKEEQENYINRYER